MDRKLIASILYDKGLVNTQNIEFEPLKGGVSSDIYSISDGENIYVIKQALEKLKVKDDWHADIFRNRIEQDFIHFMQSYDPEAVPKVVYLDREHCFFVMEFLDGSYRNWKQQLLNGHFEKRAAERGAELLAGIHLQSRDREDVKQTFDNATNFYTLRIEPYLIATADHHPDLKPHFLDEASRLKEYQEALVHGDFSPKNIMVKGEKLILLDHEAAWFGDPAFDLAFFLTHLYLKMLFHFPRQQELNDLTQLAFAAYMKKWGSAYKEALEQRTGRLLLMLLLARVDGKSPVEYLSDLQTEFVRSFVYELLPGKVYSQYTINDYWKKKLKTTTF